MSDVSLSIFQIQMRNYCRLNKLGVFFFSYQTAWFIVIFFVLGVFLFLDVGAFGISFNGLFVALLIKLVYNTLCPAAVKRNQHHLHRETCILSPRDYQIDQPRVMIATYFLECA